MFVAYCASRSRRFIVAYNIRVHARVHVSFTASAMATGTTSCRLCGTAADYKHCVALFSTLNVKSSLPGRISKLLAVPDTQNDGWSTVICRGCMRKFSAVERDLETLRQNGKKVYMKATIRRMNLGSKQRIPVVMSMCLLILLRLDHQQSGLTDVGYYFQHVSWVLALQILWQHHFILISW